MHACMHAHTDTPYILVKWMIFIGAGVISHPHVMSSWLLTLHGNDLLGTLNAGADTLANVVDY